MNGPEAHQFCQSVARFQTYWGRDEDNERNAPKETKLEVLLNA